LHISVGLIALTVFDCFIVMLTVLEYRKHLRLHLVTSHQGNFAQRTGKGK
jgi:uncharacterized membrane protein